MGNAARGPPASFWGENTVAATFSQRQFTRTDGNWPLRSAGHRSAWFAL